jgi:NADPH:quinone reductase-like Zn-dependent oxidoreductase
MGGGTLEKFNIGALSGKRAQVRGTQLRSRPLEEKATLVQTFVNRVVPLFARGKVAPVIDRVFPLDDVVEATKLMEANANFGKIVLQIT